MEFSSLQIFLAVAQEGGVSKAAQKLNYVQSNVTARIRKLEEELGVSLFYRRPRGMSLTPAGELLMQYAQKALRLMEEAQKEVTQQAEVGGKLNLGSLGSTAAVRLPGLLTAYHQQFPAVEIKVSTGRLHDLME
ncbi:MAG: LysR family transcriptional regulator, partial [Desulfarculaceae bacterium]|nr:LysR family transcriptional regulator [Desulfarculaceae bacterium]